MRVLASEEEQLEKVDDFKIQRTTDYDKFSFLSTNREMVPGHLETLKQVFDDYGNLTKVQPVLVNERFEIIDGQHRFEVCAEAGLPVYYIMVSGLGINDARSINIVHRTWDTNDYALSYAKSGDLNYQQYLKLRESFGLSHSVILEYVAGSPNRTGLYKAFREGVFVIPDLEAAERRLQQYTEVIDLAPAAKNLPFARSFLKVLSNPEYDHKQFIKKLKFYGGDVRRYGNMEDNLRQIEEVYNFKSYADNRVRLY